MMKEAGNISNGSAGGDHDAQDHLAEGRSYAESNNGITSTIVEQAERLICTTTTTMETPCDMDCTNAAVPSKEKQTANALQRIQDRLGKHLLVPNPNAGGKDTKFQEVWDLKYFLNLIGEVDKKMRHFRAYIQTLKESDKPLYQWEKYTEYRAIYDAVYGLNRALSGFTPVPMPGKVIDECRAQAMAHSTSVSKAAAFALRVMSEKTAAFTNEMESSTLSDEAKANATAHITAEVQKVLEHCTKAAGCVWAATDLLQKLEKEDTPKPTPRDGWVWSLAKVLLTTGFSAAIGIEAANHHLYGPTALDITYQIPNRTGLYNQIIDLVQQSQANTNLTSEIYAIKLQELYQRHDTLAELAESHGLRIDNLVDALGPTNTEGVYYTSAPQAEEGTGKGVDQRVLKALGDQQRQLQRQQNEMEQMRKNMNRMDVRLTKRVDKVGRA